MLSAGGAKQLSIPVDYTATALQTLVVHLLVVCSASSSLKASLFQRAALLRATPFSLTGTILHFAGEQFCQCGEKLVKTWPVQRSLEPEIKDSCEFSLDMSKFDCTFQRRLFAVLNPFAKISAL